MKEAQNRSRRRLRSELDKGIVTANFVERGGDNNLCHQRWRRLAAAAAAAGNDYKGGGMVAKKWLLCFLNFDVWQGGRLYCHFVPAIV